MTFTLSEFDPTFSIIQCGDSSTGPPSMRFAIFSEADSRYRSYSRVGTQPRLSHSYIWAGRGTSGNHSLGTCEPNIIYPPRIFLFPSSVGPVKESRLLMRHDARPSTISVA